MTINTPNGPTSPTPWRELELDGRESHELRFAELYATQFCHGTDGHNRLMLLAKLAALLDRAVAANADLRRRLGPTE
jgi:hypothetical protein